MFEFLNKLAAVKEDGLRIAADIRKISAEHKGRVRIEGKCGHVMYQCRCMCNKPTVKLDRDCDTCAGTRKEASAALGKTVSPGPMRVPMADSNDMPNKNIGLSGGKIPLMGNAVKQPLGVPAMKINPVTGEPKKSSFRLELIKIAFAAPAANAASHLPAMPKPPSMAGSDIYSGYNLANQFKHMGFGDKLNMSIGQSHNPLGFVDQLKNKLKWNSNPNFLASIPKM